MAMTTSSIIGIRTQAYANAVYIYNTNRLTTRDGFKGIPIEYYTPVEQYAAQKYTQNQIDNAYANGWINEQEYNETCAFIVNE